MSHTLTQSMVFQCELVEMNERLNRFLSDMETQRVLLNQYSAERYAHLKEGIREKLTEWQAILASSRQAIATWPKKVQNTRRVRALVREFDRCDQSTYRYLAHLQSLDDANRSSAKSYQALFQSYAQRMREEAALLSARLAKIQLNPFIAKIIEGEKTLASRGHTQWKRKFFHTATGLFGVYLYAGAPLTLTQVKLIHLSFVLFTIVVEIARRLSPKINALICTRMTGLMRERERTQISSSTWYLFSTFVVFMLFSKEIGLLSLLFVALGDTAAGLVGVKWGKRKLTEHISLEGFLAGATTCMASAYATLAFNLGGTDFHTDWSGTTIALFSVLAGLVGGIAESSFKSLDDNLVIPLLSAPLLWLLVQMFS